MHVFPLILFSDQFCVGNWTEQELAKSDPMSSIIKYRQQLGPCPTLINQHDNSWVRLMGVTNSVFLISTCLEKFGAGD